MPLLTEVKALNELRLERDLSFADLAGQMETAGYAVGGRTLHQILRGQGTPNERTLYKIRKFLASVRRSSRRRSGAAA